MRKAHRFACAVVVGLTWLCAASANAAVIQFAATVDGAQETPPNASAGSGSVSLTMDTVANTLVGTATYAGLGSAEIACHIHGPSGPGVASGILFPLGLGTPKAINIVYVEAQEADIVAGLTYINIHTSGFPGGEIRGQILRVPSCGDGILDAGETCDDGNAVSGDCCDALCQFEPLGSPCPGDDDACTVSQCDGAGACGIGAPQGGCRAALTSIIGIKQTGDDAKDKLLWKWLKGDATTQADFGLPTGTTAYTLCLYAGTTAAFLGTTAIPPGSAWAAVSDKGYKFSDASGTPDGIQKALLKGGAAGKSKILVKGKGTNLPGLLSGALPLPVTAQLVNDANSICYESVFDSADVKKNDGTQFKAKAQ